MRRPEPGRYAVRATVKALQSLGTASRVLSADIPSLNGKPAQFYELLKTACLKEIKTTSAETSSQTTLTHRPIPVSSATASAVRSGPTAG